jgi:hypothetical protein
MAMTEKPTGFATLQLAMDAIRGTRKIRQAALADQGVELPILPNGSLVRMIDQEIVREQFYAHTPADGTPEQKGPPGARSSCGRLTGPSRSS